MSTPSVPGADLQNADKLEVGSWAEDDGGKSLVFVKGREFGRVVFEIYDLGTTPVMFYQDAMLESEFKTEFSFPPVGKSKVRWTWHDKTAFPWDRVMKRFSTPVPVHADVDEQLSAAQQVAADLKLRGRALEEEEVTPHVEQRRRRGYAIMDRLMESLGRIVEKDK